MDLTQLFCVFFLLQLYIFTLCLTQMLEARGPHRGAGCPLCLRGAVRTCAGHAADNDVHVGLAPSSACARSCSSRSRTFRAARAERGEGGSATSLCRAVCRRAEKASLEAHARAAPAATPAYAGASDASHKSPHSVGARRGVHDVRLRLHQRPHRAHSRVSVSTRIAVCRSPLPARSTAAGRVFAPLRGFVVCGAFAPGGTSC